MQITNSGKKGGLLYEVRPLFVYLQIYLDSHPQANQITQPPQQTTPMSLDDYLNTMTLEDAKAVKVDCGYNAGKTLGEVAMRKPSDLDWYVQKYNGRNLALKAAAILLVNAAAQRAS